MNDTGIIDITPLGFPWQTQDPFLFCAYHRDEYPAGNEQLGLSKDRMAGRNIGQDFTIKDGFRMYHGSMVPGFPYHPHRGFETITINKEGFVDHSDSLGAAGRFGAGDVQWMTAGKGVLHSEMFPLLSRHSPNPLEIFQIWLNLPRAKKFVDPHFKMLWKEMIPKVEITDEEGCTSYVDIIAGRYQNQEAPDPTPESWAADPAHGVLILTVMMEPNASWSLPAATIDQLHRNLYFYRGGEIDIDGTAIESDRKIMLKPDQELVVKNGGQPSFLLVLQGKPIGEPIAQHGPFVMNTQEEIAEAFADYRRTQFGGWPWPMQEQVHARERGRFALHADGQEEIR